MDEMYHHGILGQKWGVRRFQNKDGTLTAVGQKRLEKKDTNWAHKNHDKIVSKARKDVSKELDQYANQLLKNPSSVTSKGKISSSAINSYNRKMAELMNESVKNVTAPSGRVYVPTDFDTKGKALSGAKAAGKGLKRGLPR